MTPTGIKIAHVIYDGARRRFSADVCVMAANGAIGCVRTSAPGHPTWSHHQITRALIEAAQTRSRTKGARHACS